MSPTLAGLFSHYLFENPWPVVGLLALIGAVLGWKGLSEGDAPKRNVALGLIGAAVVVATLASVVTTSGEHAKKVVGEFVERAEASDVDGMLDLMTSTCVLHYGRPENPGAPRDMWIGQIRMLQGAYRIESNAVTRLDSEGVSTSAATVQLACVTTVAAAGGYPTPSSWWLHVSEQPDGAWRIDRIAALRINQETPSPGAF